MSGGNSPQFLYNALADDKSIKYWDKTHVFLTDERFVAQDHQANNFKMITECLLNKIDIPKSNCHLMVSDLNDLGQSVLNYEKTIEETFKIKKSELPQFDLMLLGLGEDGHTASLFPNRPEIEENQKWVVGVADEMFGFKRLSLTLPVINHARNIVFIVKGAQKRSILEKVLAGDVRYPAARVVGNLVYLVDRLAYS